MRMPKRPAMPRPLRLPRLPRLLRLARPLRLLRPPRRLHGAAGVLVLAVLAGAALPARVRAQADAVVEDFDVRIEIDRDGSMAVTERIRLRFTAAVNGFFRTIPVKLRTDEGFGFRYALRLEDITDGNGAPLRHEAGREGSSVKYKIWLPDVGPGDVRTVRIRYGIPNGLRFFDDHDELYWNITGNEWLLPIRAVRAEIVLPPGVEPTGTWAYTGRAGERGRDAEIETAGSRIVVRTTRPFAPGDGLTVSTTWAPGAVRRPTVVQRAYWLLRPNAYVLLPLVSLFGMLALWYRKGRDPERGALVVRYEPPAGLSPGEIGTLVDHTADMRDVTATLVDLAVRGHLTIEEREERRLIGSRSTYTFHLRTPPSAWSALLPHERRLLNGLLEAGGAKTDDAFETAPAAYAPTAAAEPAGAAAGVYASIDLDDLKQKFYKHAGRIRSDLYRRLVERGYYVRRPDRVRGGYIAAGILGGVAVVFGIPLLGGPPLHPLMILVGFLFSMPIIHFGRIMPARTAAGARVFGHVLGFREFLSRVEADRLRRIDDPRLFERYLPHAMALGVEEQWAEAFDDLYDEPPDWYRGTHPTGFRATTFSRSIASMSAAAASTMSSAPSSSSSGAGGGGFSGGGGGGGGGGTF